MNTKGSKAKLFAAAFLLPALLVYLAFQIIPLGGAVYFSVTDWDGVAGTAINFVGLKNYANMFKDPAFLHALKNMGKMVFFSVLFHTPIALLLAVALNATKRGFRFFKSVYFIPTVFPLSAIGLMWSFIFIPNGVLTTLLENAGLSALVKQWLIEYPTAINVIIFVNIWAGIGYYMVILLAGLANVPEDVYEAAKIDGANPVVKLFQITIPMIKSTLIMCITMDLIGSIKVFDLVYAMTGGGPNGITNLPTNLMYQEAFANERAGVGSAIGIVILLICFTMTIITQFIEKKTSEDWHCKVKMKE